MVCASPPAQAAPRQSSPLTWGLFTTFPRPGQGWAACQRVGLSQGHQHGSSHQTRTTARCKEWRSADCLSRLSASVPPFCNYGYKGSFRGCRTGAGTLLPLGTCRSQPLTVPDPQAAPRSTTARGWQLRLGAIPGWPGSGGCILHTHAVWAEASLLQHRGPGSPGKQQEAPRARSYSVPLCVPCWYPRAGSGEEAVGVKWVCVHTCVGGGRGVC